MKKTLLPVGLVETFSHFFERFLSIIYVALAGLIFFILKTYNPFDISLNSSGLDIIHHPLSFIGSYASDFLWQFFGIYAYGLILFFIGSSVRLWQLKRLSFLTRPLCLTLGLILLGTATTSFIGVQSGTIAYLLFYLHIVPFLPPYTVILLQIAALAGSFALIGFGCYIPFSFKKIKDILNSITESFKRLGYIFYGLFKFGKPFIKNNLQRAYHHPLIRLLSSKILSPKKSSHHEATFSLEGLSPKEESSDDRILDDKNKKKSTQLSLFHDDEETHESDIDTTTHSDFEHNAINAHDAHLQGSQAISNFKEWLKEKKKNSETHKSSKKSDKITANHPIPQPSPLLGGFDLPALDLLDPSKSKRIVIDEEAMEERARELEKVLGEFGVKGEIVNVRPGPVVTMYELMPAPGIKSSRVIGLAEDIARSMCALSARIAVIPGKNVIGIELPNPSRETVYLRELLQAEAFQKASGSLRLILGKDIGGQPSIADLARMPHLLVAGTTGSGKSVAVNTMILSLLYQYTPDQCKFIMVDPKMLELSIYNDIPHLLTPVVTDPKKAVVALKWAVKEMENRYRAMSKMGVRNIDGYNTRLREAKESGEILMRKIQTGFDSESGKPVFETQPLDLTSLPYIVVIVDEMADLMLVAGKDIEATVQRLAQMARAAGIHLIMATQRPSVDVITGTIKANFPTRISFQVTSKIDSRTILGEQGAEQLLGQGDMLYMAGGGRIQRVHGPFVRDEEVERIVSFLKTQGEPSYIEAVTQDDEEEEAKTSESSNDSDKDQLYQQAVDLILREGKASTSFIQRHLQIGYNRAARLIDIMEKDGIISPANHVGKREILGRTG